MNNWERFRKARDSRKDTELICYSCPHAESFNIGEAIPEYMHSAYRNHPEFRDGKLWTKGARPQDCEACKHCFQDWIAERKLEGKICTKCGNWCYQKAGMQITATYDDGYKSISAICTDCALKMIGNIGTTKGSKEEILTPS